MPKGNLKDVKSFSKVIFNKARKEKGYTIEQLAEKVNIGTRTISRAMQKGVIKREYFEDIAQALDIQPSVLAGTYPPILNGSLNPANIKLINYPYIREAEGEKKVEYFVDALLDIVSLFDVSYDDYYRTFYI